MRAPQQTIRTSRSATALKQAGCKRIYEEKVSGATRDRPALTRMLDQLREGDVVVVARLDRLARSTRDLLEIAEILKEGGTGLRSLGEPWADTTSPAGKMVLTVFAGMAEFERALIHQRTSSGRVAATKTRGVRFGRPPKLTPEQQSLGRRRPWAAHAPVRGVWINTGREQARLQGALAQGLDGGKAVDPGRLCPLAIVAHRRARHPTRRADCFVAQAECQTEAQVPPFGIRLREHHKAISAACEDA